MATDKYAVIGWPVEHSVSPQMQQAGFDALGLEACYERLAVPPGQLGDAIERLRTEAYAGWNVTVPHKEQVGAFLDEVHPHAERGGSINTVANRNGRLTGYSTDGYGLAAALKESFDLDVPGCALAFVGAGGAARATAVYLAARGAAKIVLVNRTLAKAEAVADLVTQIAPNCRTLCLPPLNEEEVRAMLPTVDAVVQATSLGLQESDPLPLPAHVLPGAGCVMDMIYRRTPFLAAAEALGCRVADGRGMLLHQGARSLQIWTGQEPPVDIMRAALDTALA